MMPPFWKKIWGGKTASNPLEADAETERAAMEQAELAYAQRIFERYNQNKTELLLSQLSRRRRMVFELVPLMLHMPAGDWLGNPHLGLRSPHGIYGYAPGPDTPNAFKEAFPGKEYPGVRKISAYDISMPIKSLAVMGSLGSIAQTPHSDFDYWLALDSGGFTLQAYHSLRAKLNAIEQWAERFAGAEIHFFPLELGRIREDDFGEAGGESSGSAQGKLLKEEFYRTMTLVAGQAPLWWVMPPHVDDAQYARLAQVVYESPRLDDTRLVDMGNVHDISPGEFSGAALWQINKTMSSPFKSVLKMSLLEEYQNHRGAKGLLCTELKSRLLSNERELLFLDPYVLMFQRAADHLEKQKRYDDLELLRRAIYLKSGVKLTPAHFERTELPRKEQVMVGLVREWNWDRRELKKLNDQGSWSYQERRRFSQKINTYIVDTYKRVSETINRERVAASISDRDFTILGRKLFIYYERRANKIELLNNVADESPVLQSVTLQTQADKEGRKFWEAYRGLLAWDTIRAGSAAPKLLQASPHLAELLAFLVINRLYDTETSLNMNAGQGKLGTYLTLPDIQNLLKAMMNFFDPDFLKHVPEENLLKKASVTRMLAIVNLEQPDQRRDVAEVGLVYRNTWGEVSFKGYDSGDAGLKAARNFVHRIYSHDPLGALENFKFFIPDRAFRKGVTERLNKFFGMKLPVL